MKDQPPHRSAYILLMVLAIGVTLAGINVRFFTDDQGLYASIAKNIIYRKDWLQLFTYNQDWLDKPHFPFWMVAISFKLFGITTWAYRLPALLFFVVSLSYTFLFARRYYGWPVAVIAVLILITAQNVLLSNTDVRAEPYLMGLVIGSIYHVARLDERFTIGDLLLAALLTACAIMTKGVFVLVAIYGALLGQLLFQNKLPDALKLKWALLLLLTLLFTLPEFYALYRQFDIHPEKLVFGKHHVSGIRWFLWDSQFGRFINNGPIVRKTSGSIFFYLHTLLWAFAPWCLLFYYAVYKNLRDIFNRNRLTEYYTLSGGLLLLLLFSLSRFQLPFYTNTVFPLFAIITAPFCYHKLNGFETKFRLVGQWIYIILLPLIIIIVHLLLRPVNNLPFIGAVVAFIIIGLIIRMQIKQTHIRVFFLSCTAALFAGFYLNATFYNEVTPYKGQISAANYINQMPFESFPVLTFRSENNIFQFYCKKPINLISIEQFNNLKPFSKSVFYADQRSMNALIEQHASFTIIKSFLNYPQENILPKFIYQPSRSGVLDHVYLITK